MFEEYTFRLGGECARVQQQRIMGQQLVSVPSGIQEAETCRNNFIRVTASSCKP